MTRSLLILLLCPLLALAQETKLQSGTPHKANLLTDGTELSFEIVVPDDALELHVELRGCPFDVTLEVYPAAEDEDGLFEGDEDNRVRIDRAEGLTSGTFYIDVAYAGSPLIFRGKPIDALPIELEARVIRSRLDGALTAGKVISGQIVLAKGRFRSYAIDVPEGASCLRLDLFDTVGDLGMYVARKPMIDLSEDAAHVCDRLSSREVLLIDKTSKPPLKPGTYYVLVSEVTGVDGARFKLRAAFDPAPPAALLPLAPLAAPEDPRGRALASAVELFLPVSSGSGSIVSPRGLVLTNHHVVCEAIALLAREGLKLPPLKLVGRKPGKLAEVIVGVSRRHDRPSVAEFRAQILAHDPERDLALLRITSGFYGQPLPAGYRFPFVELGDSDKLGLGDRLRCVGYPMLAGLRSRPTLTLTRGVVAGLERSVKGHLRLRSDALISGGNSGGMALDEAWRLVGVPTMTTDEGPASYTFAFAVSSIPALWLKLIRSDR